MKIIPFPEEEGGQRCEPVLKDDRIEDDRYPIGIANSEEEDAVWMTRQQAMWLVRRLTGILLEMEMSQEEEGA